MPKSADELLLRDLDEGVLTLTMNNPKRLNGWTMEMMDAIKAAFKEAATNDDIKAIILTGTGKYYCAGVNLGATLKLDHPKKLHGMIVEQNQALVDAFLDCPKPILVAANGPAIGASVTSATSRWCDCIGERYVLDAFLRTRLYRKGAPACISPASWVMPTLSACLAGRLKPSA